MSKGKSFSDFTYGVGLEYNASSYKQVKDALKGNLDNLIKMVRSYEAAMKVEPDMDLSKLVLEVKNLSTVVGQVRQSGNPFSEFVDKGVLQRVAVLESGMQDLVNTSAELKTGLETLTKDIKEIGAAKMPTAFGDLFNKVPDQSAKIKNVTNQIEKYELAIKKIKDAEEYFYGDIDKEQFSTNDLKAWANELKKVYKEINDTIEANGGSADLNVEKNFIRVIELATKLKKALNLDELGEPLVLDIKGIITELEGEYGSISTIIEELTGKISPLKSELNELQNLQNKFDLQSKRKTSNTQALQTKLGSEYTADVKLTPTTDASEWVNHINKTINSIQDRISPVRLTPTFSKASKNVEKDLDGNLASINHSVAVTFDIKDNLGDFETRINNLDKSIKSAKERLEQNTKFKLGFTYEDGEKFHEVVWPIINELKKVDVNLSLKNKKSFLTEVANLKKATEEKMKNIGSTISDEKIKDISIGLSVKNQEELLKDIDNIRAQIEGRIGNVGINLSIENAPQFMLQMMAIKAMTDGSFNGISPPNGTSTITSNTTAIVELSEAAKKAQEEIRTIKSALEDLEKNGFNSDIFKRLGIIGPNMKMKSGSKKQVQQMLDEYNELLKKTSPDGADWRKTYPATDKGYKAFQQDLSRLEKLKTDLNSVVANQQAYILHQLSAAEERLKVELEINNTQKSQQKAQPDMSMSAEEATKKYQELNTTIAKTQKILNSLNKSGYQSSYFTKIGEWDKQANSFKKNTKEMEKLVSQYNKLKEKNKDRSNFKSDKGYNASIKKANELRGRISSIVTSQKKHVSEFLAEQQSQLKVVESTLDAQKQASQSGANTSANIDKAAESINNEGKAAKEAAELKKQFAAANEAVAQSGEKTASGTESAAKGIKKEAKESKGATQAIENLVKAQKKLGNIGGAAVLEGLDQKSFEKFAAQVAESEGMKLGSVSVTMGDDDNMRVATVKMLNEELAQSVTYTYQLIKLEDDLTEAYLTSYRTQGDVNKALKQRAQQQKKSDKERSSNNQWLIQQMASLDKKTRKYQTGSKKIAGSTELISDASSLAKDAEQTIDSLATHIRSTIQNALGKTLTSNLKEQILNDLRILENEISVKQNSEYSATTMAPSTVEKNKQAYIQALDTIEARAKKANVFNSMKSDIESLKKEINNVSDAQGLNKFVENFKVVRNKFQAEVAKFNQSAAENKFGADLADAQSQFDKFVMVAKDWGLYLDEDKFNVDSFTASVDKLGNSLKNISDSKALITWRKQFKTLKDDSGISTSDMNNIAYQKEYKEWLKIQSKIKEVFGESTLNVDFTNKIGAYKQALEELKIAQKNFFNNPSNVDFANQFGKAKEKVQALRQEIEDTVDATKEFDKKYSDPISEPTKVTDPTNLKQLKDEMKALAIEVSNGTFEFKGMNDAGTEMYGTMKVGANAIQEVTIALRSGTNEIAAYKGNIEEIPTVFSQLKSTLTSTIGQLATMYLSLYDIIRYVRNGVEAVREIDLAMTELKKVTDETDESYAKFLETASKTSSTIGATLKDFTTVTSDFARLGYSMEDAADLARVALVYENVGDGFSSVSEASESIISTMKAFGIEATDTMEIVDKFNEVGNNFAITSKGIGDALQRSASSLYEAGNTLDESIGLITGMNSVVQDPEQVGEINCPAA